MKLLSTLLTIGLLLGLNLAMGQETQNFRKYSVGLRVAHLYDLPSYRFDSELSKDMKGLNGPFTSFDLGLNLYGEAQLTPLVGFQGGLRIGGLSGANELEYFENQFQQGYLDMLFVLSNINKERKGLPLNYYAKVGLGVGAFEVERYLKSDKSLNGHFNGGYWEGRLGAGMQYELSPVLRLDLQVAYNIAFDDGFDGYDYNTGSDPYLSTGIGIAYTFGDPEVKPMYSVRLFGPEYGGAAIGPTEAELAQADSSRKMMVGLFGQLEAMNQQMNTQSDLISKQQLVLAGQNDSIAHYNEKLKEQTQVINELRTELAHAKESGKENAEAPVTHWQKEQHQVQVYFDFDSDVLTPETKKILIQALQGSSLQITLVGYASAVGAPAYNEKLKMRRVKSVKAFLADVLRLDPSSISTEIAGEVADLKENNYLNRKVLVKYSEKLTTSK